MKSILIKNGRIWDGERFFNGDILTEGETILKIADKIEGEAQFVYDAQGKIVSAGLVDIHVHLKGISNERFGIQAEMSSFPFGVTAVNNAGSKFGNKALSDSFEVKNTVFVGVKIEGNRADFTDTEEHLYEYGDKAIGVKVYFDASGLDGLDISALEEVCDYAASRKLKVMVHCSNSPASMSDIVRTLNKGDILTHAFHGGRNSCTDNDFEAFKMAKERGVIIDSGFAGYVHTDFKKLKDSIRAGFLPDTISTDITCASAYIRGGRYGMTMCMNIAEYSGMSQTQVFKAVTANPARVLGKEQEWGFLKEGRCADIAVFDYTNEGFDMTDNAGNRIYSEKGYRCVLTVVNGQVLYRY